jgi:hypothetical protein
MLLCLSLLAASSVWAADAGADRAGADRAAIEKIIATLNSSPGTPGLFTDDFTDNEALIRLGVYRNAVKSNAIACVSPEVWGEMGCRAIPSSSIPAQTAGHLATHSVKMITIDVALADVDYDRALAGGPGHSQGLLVLRRDGASWKIASVRVIAPPPG